MMKWFIMTVNLLNAFVSNWCLNSTPHEGSKHLLYSALVKEFTMNLKLN